MIFSSQYSGFGRKEVVEYLLQYGADVHAKDDGGFLFLSPIDICNTCNFLPLFVKKNSLFQRVQKPIFCAEFQRNSNFCND